jgi:hypothetical protein
VRTACACVAPGSFHDEAPSSIRHTPEMVVDGHYQSVGRDEASVERVIAWLRLMGQSRQIGDYTEFYSAQYARGIVKLFVVARITSMD